MSVEYEVTFSAPPFNSVEAKRISSTAFEIATRTAGGDIHAEVVKRTPYGVGTLQTSILPNTVVTASAIEGTVRSSLLYAKFVETGTRARREGNGPPFGPLNLWVRRKFKIPAGPQADAITWKVIHKIIREGTSDPRFTGTGGKGHWMFKRGLEAARSRVEKLFADTLVIVVEKIAKL